MVDEVLDRLQQHLEKELANSPNSTIDGRVSRVVGEESKGLTIDFEYYQEADDWIDTVDINEFESSIDDIIVEMTDFGGLIYIRMKNE